jgi:hypothetical protein
MSEEQKYQMLLKVYNRFLYGLISGLWQLFGESSFATVREISSKLLSNLEEEGLVQIKGSNTNEVLNESAQILTAVGLISKGDFSVDENGKVSLGCHQCALTEVTKKLEAENIQPFACFPMLFTTAGLAKQTGAKFQLLGRKFEPEKEICTVEFMIR